MKTDSVNVNKDNRYPDIEIYVRAVSLETIEAWLNTIFNEVQLIHDKKQSGSSHQYTLRYQEQSILLLVIENAIDDFISLWFQSSITPWADDITCAREAYAFFDQEVRCSTGSWQEDNDDQDQWFFINEDGDGVLCWAFLS